LPEKQVTLKKDPTDSMQLLTKSPPDGSQIKSSIAKAAAQSFIAEAALQSSVAEASPQSSIEESPLQSSTAEAALQSSAALKTSKEAVFKTSEEAALKTSEEAALKTSEEAALKTSEEAALKTSEEAALKTETMCSSKKLAVNESLCISSQVCNIFDKDPSQTVLTESAIKADMPITSDVTGRAKKAAKKDIQRAANYGIEKLPPVPSILLKQETFPKDPTGSVAMYTALHSSENTSQDIDEAHSQPGFAKSATGGCQVCHKGQHPGGIQPAWDHQGQPVCHQQPEQAGHQVHNSAVLRG
jgi:hypothetical protein